MAEEEDLLLAAGTEDLTPITEELNAAERAEFEHNLHPVQPSPANRLVLLYKYQQIKYKYKRVSM